MGRVLDRQRKKGASRGKFLQAYYAVFNTSHYYSLGVSSRAILHGIAIQYNGKNNGNLSASHSMSKAWGVRSRTTLIKALNELLDKRFIVKTRQGLFAKSDISCNLFAITWESIDEIDGMELDIKPTITPYFTFKQIIEGN